MNPMAAEARRALTASGYATRNNLCQKWARQVVESVLGGKPMGPSNPASAKGAAEYLLDNGVAVRSSVAANLEPGDLLYKTVGSGGYGHVGIYLGDGKVAENSSVHWHRSGQRDARGIRTLAEFGAFQAVARFPVAQEVAVKPKPTKPQTVTFYLNGKTWRPAYQLRDGGEVWVATAANEFVPLRRAVRLFGGDVEFNNSVAMVKV